MPPHLKAFFICLFLLTPIIISNGGCTMPKVGYVQLDNSIDYDKLNDQIIDELYPVTDKQYNLILKNNPSPLPPTSTPYKLTKHWIKNISKLATSTSRQEFINKIEITIIDSDELFFLSYPPNRLLISHRIFYPDLPGGVQNEAQFVGLLLHEICHLVYHHTENKWKWVAVGNKHASYQYGSPIFTGIFNMVSPVGIVVDNSNHQISHPDAESAYWYTESCADLFALTFLQMLNLPKHEYYSYFLSLTEAKEQLNNSTFSQHLEERLYRLEAYFEDISTIKKTLMAGDYTLVVKRLNGQNTLESLEHYKQNIFENNKLARAIYFWKFACRQNRGWLGYEKEMFRHFEVPIQVSNGELIYPLNRYEVYLPENINNIPSFILFNNT